jgi:pimeloyl-ACP methyl ester carboxylesterase
MNRAARSKPHTYFDRMRANAYYSTAVGKGLTDRTQGSAMKTDLHATEIGQGEPIVFIHGAFDPAEETFGKQKELADQYRVVLVDRRGYGESPAADRLDFDAQERCR